MMRWSRRSLLIPGLIALGVAIVLLHVLVDDLHLVWSAVGIGTVLLAIAALITAAVGVKRYIDDRANELEARQDELDHKFNGGMIEVMTTIFNDEIESGRFRIDLVKRVADMEERLDEAIQAKDLAEADRLKCLEREREWQRLKARMSAFLDENGAGRSESREDDS